MSSQVVKGNNTNCFLTSINLGQFAVNYHGIVFGTLRILGGSALEVRIFHLQRTPLVILQNTRNLTTVLVYFTSYVQIRRNVTDLSDIWNAVKLLRSIAMSD